MISFPAFIIATVAVALIAAKDGFVIGFAIGREKATADGYMRGWRDRLRLL